ncbi:MAG: diadenylate cyclase CdaA [Deltaproteobacteria bacterium]|jgi:diadenylate cyclase|nr:diadenylate cyclase CdaA [Deltaproteobacteria bacterium]
MLIFDRLAIILDAIQSMRWEDVVDILLVSLIFFYVIRLIKGTRSVQVFLGLVPLGFIFGLSLLFQFFTLSFIMYSFLSNIFILIVLLFSTDIRRGLARAGRFSFFRTNSATLEAINEVVRASFFMAEKRVGALIVFERRVSLGEYMESAAKLSAVVSDRLLLAIFNTHAPLHDGAVIIQDGKLEAAGCFLPLLPTEDNVSRFFGTRHRAAIGLSRETDALIVVVSEERGLVSLVRDGEVEVMMGAGSLRDKLQNLLGLSSAKKKKKTANKLPGRS